MEQLAILDFDGVICDSVWECLVSSWKAYYELLIPPPPLSVPLSLKRDFFQLRPLVRSGEDFVAIQEIIYEKKTIDSQSDFDAYTNSLGPSVMLEFKKLFYSARAEILNTDREYWIGLNHIYPHIRKNLPWWVDSPLFYILSTKKAEYILEILAQNRVNIDPARVLTCNQQKKMNMVLQLLEQTGVHRAYFVDDQIDHLRGGSDNRVDVALASWGYVKKEWLQNPMNIQVLRAEDLGAKLEFLYQPLVQ